MLAASRRRRNSPQRGAGPSKSAEVKSPSVRLSHFLLTAVVRLPATCGQLREPESLNMAWTFRSRPAGFWRKLSHGIVEKETGTPRRSAAERGEQTPQGVAHGAPVCCASARDRELRPGRPRVLLAVRGFCLQNQSAREPTRRTQVDCEQPDKRQSNQAAPRSFARRIHSFEVQQNSKTPRRRMRAAARRQFAARRRVQAASASIRVAAALLGSGTCVVAVATLDAPKFRCHTRKSRPSLTPSPSASAPSSTP